MWYQEHLRESTGGVKQSLFGLVKTARSAKSAEHPGLPASPHANSIALSVLVTIEMFNALNALSEEESLLTFTPRNNPYLLWSICLSMLLHFAVLYIPALAAIFGVTPLTTSDWLKVVCLSAPVIPLEEALKWVQRRGLPGRLSRAKAIGARGLNARKHSYTQLKEKP